MMSPVTADEKDGCREWAFLGILSREIVEGRGESGGPPPLNDQGRLGWLGLLLGVAQSLKTEEKSTCLAWGNPPALLLRSPAVFSRHDTVTGNIFGKRDS